VWPCILVSTFNNRRAVGSLMEFRKEAHTASDASNKALKRCRSILSDADSADGVGGVAPS